jgi:DNA-binding LytR/AlgR family response regulator
LKIAICEDEKIFSDKLLELVKSYFKNHNQMLEVSVFTDGIPLIDDYKNRIKYDLIFLDIQLEISDGVNVAAQLREFDKEAAIVFVTGLENRAVEGYAVSAFDYIIKSSLDDRLSDVLDRFMQVNKAKFLTVTTLNGETEIILCNDILYIESDGRGTAISTMNSIIRTSLSVNKVYQLLPQDNFVEIHKSVFVMVTKIKRIGSDNVLMCNEKLLPLSRRKRKQVLSAVMAAVKGGEK